MLLDKLLQPRPWFRFLPMTILGAILSLAMADLLVLTIRKWALPKQPPPMPAQSWPTTVTTGNAFAKYAQIVEHNIFNEDGIIPEPFGLAPGEFEIDESKAVASTLPIQLIATVVHIDPARSLAAMVLTSAAARKVFRVGDDVENLAEIVAIHRGKVFLRARESTRLEFVAIPIEEPIRLGEFGAAEGIRRESDSSFSIDRSALERQTADLGGLLQQAQSVPEIGPQGQVKGFRVLSVQPGSLFTQIGIRAGDVITAVNGQKLNNVASAMDQYARLKGAESINLEIERNGRAQTLHYAVR